MNFVTAPYLLYTLIISVPIPVVFIFNLRNSSGELKWLWDGRDSGYDLTSWPSLAAWTSITVKLGKTKFLHKKSK